MIRILTFSFFDLIRSRWSLIYFSFYFLLTFVLLFLNNSLSKSIITLLNIIIVLTPLVGIIFGVMYYYNSKEFTLLLLAQPIKRSSIFIGQYLGLSISLSLSLGLGLFIPYIFYGIISSTEIWNFFILIIIGIFLNFITVALAYNIALRNDNKIRGFGYAIFVWLFLAVIYDGIFLVSLNLLYDYPLDKFSLFVTMLNPIDLSRILVLLKLDISALMGYTGAVFKLYFGSIAGTTITFFLLILWILIPMYTFIRKANKKDF